MTTKRMKRKKMRKKKWKYMQLFFKKEKKQLNKYYSDRQRNLTYQRKQIHIKPYYFKCTKNKHEITNYIFVVRMLMKVIKFKILHFYLIFLFFILCLNCFFVNFLLNLFFLFES